MARPSERVLALIATMLVVGVAAAARSGGMLGRDSSVSAEIGSETSNGGGNDGLREERLAELEYTQSTAIEIDPSRATINKEQPDLCSRKTFPKAMGSQKTSSIAGSNKEIEEQSDVASAKTFPKATGAGAPIVSQQGLKKKYQKNRKLIEVAPETSPIAGSNKEKEKHSDVASTNFPKAMGAGAPTMSPQGLKKKYHKHRNLIEVDPSLTMPQQGLKKKYSKHRKLIGVAPETSPIAGSNKEIDEHSDAASAKGHPKAMHAGVPTMSQQRLKKKHNKRRNLIGVATETSPIAGSNKEIDEHSDAASAKGHPRR
ncbi:uncharacterized protein LOC131176081 [Hevea brasiliensis]|uniref:uncharacterized protein LOC131176081 n=1 Tax=Hevea brasiliensis TaxID=3981 RepID=UPI0025FD2E04|nr:uncharacterized protein LOC131176081 [Hevea brasiliensis]